MKLLWLGVLLQPLLGGEILCNNFNDYSPLEELSLGADTCTVTYSSFKENSITIIFTEDRYKENRNQFTLVPKSIFTLPSIRTTNLITQDLIYLSELNEEFHSITEYVKLPFYPSITICTALECAQFPYTNKLFLINTPFKYKHLCLLAKGTYIPVDYDLKEIRPLGVCISLFSITIGDELELILSAPSATSLYYLSSLALSTLHHISHGKGFPKEKTIHYPDSPLKRYFFPFDLLDLSDQIDNKTFGFSLSRRLFHLQNSNYKGEYALRTGRKFYWVKERTRRLNANANANSATNEGEKEIYLEEVEEQWEREQREDHVTKGRLVMQIYKDYFPQEKTLPMTGRYSAMYTSFGGYENRKGNHSLTGALALQRFLEMEKERRDTGKETSAELNYWREGETQLFCLKTAMRNRRDETALHRIERILGEVKRRDWDKEGVEGRYTETFKSSSGTLRQWESFEGSLLWIGTAFNSPSLYPMICCVCGVLGLLCVIIVRVRAERREKERRKQSLIQEIAALSNPQSV